MRYFVSHSIVPVRSGPSDPSEMVTQLLFGECVKVLEKDRNWLKIKVEQDDYEGWIDEKMVLSQGSNEVSSEHARFYVHSPHLLGQWKRGTETVPVHLTLGASVELKQLENFVFEGGWEFEMLDTFELLKPVQSGAALLDIARLYIGAPYLWGGKTLWGIDCSGFTQMVFRMCGMDLPRDASQQVQKGFEITFGTQRAGDLAFFQNKSGKVIHVGILTGDGYILHASGRVRYDKFGIKGIENLHSGQLTHTFHSIKRYLR